MAVDVAASRADREAPSAPSAFACLAAVPAWVWLAGIVVASFGGRLFAAAARLAPYYLPDEYIYPTLARSLADHGRPLIRGVGVHFPALLDPILTAPVWLVTDDPVTAFRLTQGIHAVFFSLAAIPAYLLCRRLELPSWIAIAVAALAVAVPDGVYASTMLADPLAYPLVLAAVYAGVCMVTDPTRRMQLAFAAFSALAVLARVQYVVVPLAVLGAELVADRGRILRSLRRVWLAVTLLVVPPAVLFGTLGSDRVLGVYAHGDHAFHAGSILHWTGREAMLLAYSGGWVIVPGALAGLLVALLRPRRRAELAFAVTAVLLAGALLFEAAQIADTDSQRFQERYLFSLVPLLGAAFGVYVRRGLPGRIPVGLISAALLLLAARVPLSGSSRRCCRESPRWSHSGRCRRRSPSSPRSRPRWRSRPAPPPSTSAQAEACATRCRGTSAGSTTRASARSTSSLRRAPARSSRGNSCSGTPPSRGCCSSAVLRSTTSRQNRSASRGTAACSWTAIQTVVRCSSRPTRPRSSSPE